MLKHFDPETKILTIVCDICETERTESLRSEFLSTLIEGHNTYMNYVTGDCMRCIGQTDPETGAPITMRREVFNFNIPVEDEDETTEKFRLLPRKERRQRRQVRRLIRAARADFRAQQGK